MVGMRGFYGHTTMAIHEPSTPLSPEKKKNSPPPPNLSPPPPSSPEASKRRPDGTKQQLPAGKSNLADGVPEVLVLALAHGKHTKKQTTTSPAPPPPAPLSPGESRTAARGAKRLPIGVSYLADGVPKLLVLLLAHSKAAELRARAEERSACARRKHRQGKHIKKK